MSGLTVADRPLLRRLAERVLAPWYSPELEAAKMRRSEEIRLRAITARKDLEKVRRDYLLVAERLRR